MRKYIPSAITAGNLICGFAAIQIGDFYWSPILLVCSFIFDGLDGLVARALGVTSEFGKQMDSLADVVSFGVAPAYLYYLLAPDPDDCLLCKKTESLRVFLHHIYSRIYIFPSSNLNTASSSSHHISLSLESVEVSLADFTIATTSLYIFVYSIPKLRCRRCR